MSDGKKQNDAQEKNLHEDKVPIEDIHQACLSEIAMLQGKLAEAEGKYKRALADFQNLERQTQESHKRFAKLATSEFVQDLIAPYDNLLLAAQHIGDKGLDMVITNFRQVFESQGLQELQPKGERFDAATMEAVDTREGDADMVVEVTSCGYMLNGIVIRPAKVIVGTSASQ